MYKNLINSFKDTIDDNPFESMTLTLSLKYLKDSDSNLNFLIGPAGSGKTFILKKYFSNEIYLQPILTKEEIDKNLSKDKIILVDEAQLLDIKLLEYIRILSDNGYRFILAMHLDEAKEILQKEHFKSRNINVVTLQSLTKEEMIKYLNIKLLQNNANHIFSKAEFNKIYNYTNGNFRYIKKFVKTLFELLQFATENNLKYKKIDNCLLTMSAIHLGLEND
jgi:hypothetical protein